MNLITRPLLSASIKSPKDLEKLRFPMFASPKVDGIRVLIHPKLGAVSRSFKPIRNQEIQRFFDFNPLLHFLDGEIITTPTPTASNVFNKTTSDVMSSDGPANFTYLVFDDWKAPHLGYDLRRALSEEQVRRYILDSPHLPSDAPQRIESLSFAVVRSIRDVLEYEEKCLAEGYEGIMLRAPHAPYKSGRSTLNEQILVKLKRVEDDEAMIVDFHPLERNLNPQERDAFGLAKRSTTQAGRVADELLGTLVVEHPTFGQFGIGSGFDVNTRIDIWQNRDTYRGRTISFKYQKVGVVDKPRFPIFKGFRDKEDIS